MRNLPRRSAAALAVFFIALFATEVAGAGSATTTLNRSENRVVLVRSVGGVAGSPDGFTDVPGAKAVMTVGPDEVLAATFGTAIACSGPEVATYCAMRVIVVNNTTKAVKELLPGPVRFDSVTGPDDDFESHMAEWSSDPLPAGTYTVRVQYTAREKQDKPLAMAKLLKWHLRVERLAA
jgi:hypothetical protein